ncbi:MAG: hypothetical protein NTX03_11295 [Bacteroidetes bacterium]|nr:hypothetical protein [Bacteroidota bacterium]
MKKLILILLCILASQSIFAQKEKELFKKAQEKLANDDVRGAIKLLDNAIKIKVDYLDAYYNRGTAKLALLDFPGAILDFDNVIKLNPNYASAYYNRSVAKAKMKNFDAALEDVEKVVDMRPNYAKAYALRGQLKKNTKDKGGACEDFRTAIELGDKSVESVYRVLCSDSKTKVVVKKEDLIITWPDTMNWKTPIEEVYGLQSTQAYWRKDETAEKFSMKGEIRKIKGTTNALVGTEMQQIYDNIKATCPAARLTQLDQEDKTETPWIIFTIECPDAKIGSSIYCILQGNSALFTIKLTTPHPAMEEDLSKNWSDVFREVKTEFK